MRRIALHSGHLNWAWMTFIRNFTAIASAVTLTVGTSVVLLSNCGVHRIANSFYCARLHCLLRVSELRWVFLSRAFLSFHPIFRVLFRHRFLNQSERAYFRNRYMINFLLPTWDTLRLKADWILLTFTAHAVTWGEGHLWNRWDFAHGFLVRSAINLVYSVISFTVFLGLSLNEAWGTWWGRVYKALILLNNWCMLFSPRSRGVCCQAATKWRLKGSREFSRLYWRLTDTVIGAFRGS